MKRKRELVTDISNVRARIKKAPEGKLRVSISSGRVQYYYRTDKKDTEGSYIRNSERELAERLAQKDYDTKILPELEKELRDIDRLLLDYQKEEQGKCYKSLHEKRRILVNPVEEDDETFISKWNNIEYNHMGFSEKEPEFYTQRGERVRSKTEVIIADALARYSIPYRYEYPIQLVGMGWVHPDFYCLNTRTRKEYVWEHFGMMGRESYARDNIEKINSYILSGYVLGKNMIATFESYEQPIWTKMIERVIHEYLE